MLKAVLRERRKRKWMSTRKWQEAQRKKRRLEEQLGKIEKRLEPDSVHNVNGILIAVYKCRGRYRPEIRFEFYRKDPHGPASDFGEGDLKALIAAIQAAHLYRSDVA